MQKRTHLIYFPAGCYGTFFEWLYSYFNNKTANISIPFTSTGSSHNYIGNFLTNPQLFDYIESKKETEIVRIHPSIFDKVNSNFEVQTHSYYNIVARDLNYVNKYFNKVVVLHPSPTTKLWVQNNCFEKCVMSVEIFETFYKPFGFTQEFFSENFPDNMHDRIKIYLEKYCGNSKANSWNKNSIKDLEIWELREFLSVYWETRYFDSLTCWSLIKLDFPDVKFISLDDLKNNPVDTILDYLNFLSITNVDTNDLINIVNQWKVLQKHYTKDNDVNQIVNAIIKNKYYDWSDKDFSIIDEAYIQHNLRHNGINLKCFNLNKFPSSTKTLESYIEKVLC